jgi:hypothetical protein
MMMERTADWGRKRVPRRGWASLMVESEVE